MEEASFGDGRYLFVVGYVGVKDESKVRAEVEAVMLVSGVRNIGNGNLRLPTRCIELKVCSAAIKR